MMDQFRLSHFRTVSLSALLALGLTACGDREADAPPPPPPAAADPAPAASPAPAPSFSEAGLDAINARLEQLVADQDRSGVVMMLAREGQIQHVAAAGYADIAAETAMTADTPVRIASMTKPITAAAIMALVEDGEIALTDPVSTYIPAFANAQVATSLQVNEEYEIPTEPLTRPITIEDLLTHTSGVGYIFDYQTNLGALYISEDIYRGGADYTMDQRMETLAGLPLYFQPGERWHYSYSNDVLGHVVEVVSGESLDAFMDARIFTPLGMNDTTFFPDDALMERLATLYTHDDLGDMVAVEGADDAVRAAPFAAGGAGLISTASDYMRFAQMLANGGVLDGQRVLSQQSVDAMTTPHIPLEKMPQSMADVDMAFGYSLGVIVDGPGAHPFRQVGDFGWGGYFDTNFVVSPSTGMVAVIMAQEQPGASTPDTTGARDVFEALAYGALPTES
jgi:CubicO group peptidase (beta-lactamase class C family)